MSLEKLWEDPEGNTTELSKFIEGATECASPMFRGTKLNAAGQSVLEAFHARRSTFVVSPASSNVWLIGLRTCSTVMRREALISLTQRPGHRVTPSQSLEFLRYQPSSPASPLFSRKKTMWQLGQPSLCGLASPSTARSRFQALTYLVIAVIILQNNRQLQLSLVTCPEKKSYFFANQCEDVQQEFLGLLIKFSTCHSFSKMHHELAMQKIYIDPCAYLLSGPQKAEMYLRVILGEFHFLSICDSRVYWRHFPQYPEKLRSAKGSFLLPLAHLLLLWWRVKYFAKTRLCWLACVWWYTLKYYEVYNSCNTVITLNYMYFVIHIESYYFTHSLLLLWHRQR